MLHGIDVLDIEQKQIRERQQLLKRTEEGFLMRKRLARRVDGCGHALFLCKAKEFRYKLQLQQRLSAADGDAARLFPVGTVTHRLPKDLLRRRLVASLRCPCLGIVAVLAAIAASLHKDDEADARPVNRAEALRRTDAALTCGHGRYVRSHPPAARASG